MHSLTVFSHLGEIRIPFHRGASLRDILLSAGFSLRSSCGGNGLCGQCAVRVDGRCGEAELVEKMLLPPEQLQSGMRLACRLFPEHDLNVTLDAQQTAVEWRALRGDEYGPPFAPPPVPGATRYGVAIDLGTTHIRASLWDRHRGVRLAGRSGLNPQRIFGADVLTRLMEAARSAESAQRLTRSAQGALAQVLLELAAASSIATGEIGEVCVVGNTAMLSLLSGRNHGLLLQPEYWTQRIDCAPLDMVPLRAAWGLSGAADIRFLPPLGGFIGSDILADIASAGIMQSPPGTLLVDFGTNTEMALWDGSELHVTAAAGGPAFEGSGIQHGMPGEAGAICHVRPGKEGAFELDVLGGGAPQGICGSGLVDAIACLLDDGSLDRIGRLQAPDAGLPLYAGERSIVLTRRDIDVFQRAKAAIGAGVRWLCAHAGMRMTDLRHVHACGAFGRLLDIANARAIGLLPPLSAAAIELQGNTALAGCERLLLTGDDMQQDILAAVRVHNMAEEQEFESLFVESLYLEPMQD